MRRRSSRTFVGLALLYLGLPIASPGAQTPAPLPPDPMIQSLVNMVSADTLLPRIVFRSTIRYEVAVSLTAPMAAPAPADSLMMLLSIIRLSAILGPES